MEFHQPVLLQETIRLLDPRPGKTIVDATLGHGGHSIALLQAGATVYGFDQDVSNIQIAQKRLRQYQSSHQFWPINDNFINISQYLSKPVNGILFDLGLSQNQQKSSNRGFSFHDHLSLDMRLDPKNPLTAENIINTWSFDQLYEIFTKYGQELQAKPIILRLIRQRQKSPIKTAQQLADIIRQYYQEKHLQNKTDPATKIFLSLKIAVNHEQENLQKALSSTLRLVEIGGTCCFISYHSTEDRLVKKFIAQQVLSSKIQKNRDCRPSRQEILQNPLARSAILRSYTII